MSLTGICPNNTAPFVLTNDGWAFSYLFLFGLTFVLLILYLVLLLTGENELFTQRPKLRGYLEAVWWFIGQLSFRSIGCLVCGAFLASINNAVCDNCKIRFGDLETIFFGLPGYVTSISYCFLFALWSSIATNLICNDTSGAYEQRRKYINIINLIIILLATILIILKISISYATPSSDPNKESKEYKFHLFEVILAILRDFICATFFLFQLHYLRLSYNRQNHFSIFNVHNAESSLLLLCYTISIALCWRIISIIVYASRFLDRPNRPSRGCSRKAYGVHLYHQIVTEIIPMVIIVIGHKRTALLTCYDPF